MKNIQDLPPMLYGDKYNYSLKIERNEFNKLWELKYIRFDDYCICFSRNHFLQDCVNQIFTDIDSLKDKGVVDY